MKRSLFSAVLLCSALLAQPAMADWQVNNADSEFHFVSIKAGQPGTAAIPEVLAFKKISGTVSDKGNIQFQVDLASVDTGIELRDQRIKDLLFKVADFPTATFDGKANMGVISKMGAGISKDIDVDGTITIAGVTKPLAAKLRVVKLAGPRLLVQTRAPLIINAADFGLQAGVEALRTVMGLNVLSSAVPVTFSIVLK